MTSPSAPSPHESADRLGKGCERPLVAWSVLIAVWLFHGAVTLFLYKTTEVPPYYDAANHFNIAADIKDHLDRFQPTAAWLRELYNLSAYYPPGYHLIAAVGMKFVRFNLDAARLPNLLFLGILIASVYLFGRRLFDGKTGVLAGVLVSFFPIVHGLTREIYIDLALLAWVALAFYLLLRTDHFQSPLFSFLFGAVCGLGLLTKWTFPVFLAGPVLWVLSETFLLYSPSKMALGFLGGEKEEPLERRVRRALLVAVGFLGALYSLRNLTAEDRLFLPWAAAFWVFLTVGIVSWRSRGEAPSFPQLKSASHRAIPPLPRSLMGMILAAAPMLLLAAPWYLAHLDFIASEGSRVLTQAAEVRGMARPGTAASAFYYLITLESHQLGLPLWLIALASLGFLFRGGGLNRSGWLLGLSFAVSYLLMSALWVKDPRYFMPALYPLPILMADWLLNRPAEKKRVWIAGTLLVGLIGFVNHIYGIPILEKRRLVSTPLGAPLQITGPAVYGDLLGMDGDWPHRPFVLAIQREAWARGNPDGPLNIPVLVDDGFLHAPALDCYARVLGADLRFFNIATHPDLQTDPGYVTRLLAVLRSPYFITKQGGFLGFDFVAGAYRPLLERLVGDQPGWSAGVRRLMEHPLPAGRGKTERDSASATLWANTFPSAFLGERQPVDIRLANGVRLAAFRRSRADPPRKANPEVVQVEWVPEPREKLAELIRNHEFFLHLVEQGTGRFLQGQNFPLSAEDPEVASFRLQHASPPTVLAMALFEPRKDLLPGRCELRLGMFNVQTLEKVAVADPVEEIETSLPLGEPFVYEPEGWQFIHAEFEDREALKARDEIGSVALESARFDPRSAHPGEEVRLEAHWSVRWLELEAPEEQNVRAFAYLLPSTPGPESKPVAYTEWTLDVLGHSGGEAGYWSTESRLSVPSDIPEGLWRVHIGVRRPVYERSFLIRNGPQRDRTAFALRTPLFIGHDPWLPIRAEYPSGLGLEAARVLSATTAAGAETAFEVAWRASSATALIEAASFSFLYCHLFSLEEEAYAQLDSLPMFRRERIRTEDPRLISRRGESFLEAIRSGFVERYPLRLSENLLPGSYRLDFGVYNPTLNLKETATLPGGTLTTTLGLPELLHVKGVD